ncbi:MAG TPA: folate-binding protein [Caulobacteraceae bacterium]|nr:folate-binding protein [Caulobacteraceae bacterium]
MTSSDRIIALQSRAVVEVSGPDWRSFLQGLTTNDVETLAPGAARFAALLSPQGRILFDLFVIGGAGGCLIDVAAERRDDFVQRLKLYRLRAKVEIRPLDLGVFAILDAHAAAPGWVVDPRLPALGVRGYTADGRADDVEIAYDVWRMTLGVPGAADWGYDKTFPIEADFDLLNGIDFRKGCFVGQETTSRMKRRGKIRSRMLPIVFEGPAIAPGSEILAGELRAGEVLSGAPGLAMALVRLDRIEDVHLTVDGRAVVAMQPGWFL